MHWFGFALLVFVFFCYPAAAQKPQTDTAGAAWSFGAEGYYYVTPHDNNLFSFTGYADHKSGLHLEARYNYEDRNTVSAFAGWRLETGNKLAFAATPMIGFMAGNSRGIIPALELELNYKRLDFYSETEYVIDFSGKENTYLYTWSELSFRPLANLYTGVSIQRSLAYQTGYEVQKGPMVKYAFRSITAGFYYFNPFTSNNVFVFSVGADF